MFAAEIKIKGVQYKCVDVLSSWVQNIDISQLTDRPDWKDFLVQDLGGSLLPYEDYLDGIITEPEERAMSKYNKENFVKHFMYKLANDGRVVSQYAETHEEHLALANLGYVHDPKGF